MQTLSVLQVRQALQQVVAAFENVEGYKVEISLWDHQPLPVMQLYVACTIAGEHKSIHTTNQTLAGSLEEIKQWYTQIRATDYLVEVA
jgi:hypothetical protein